MVSEFHESLVRAFCFLLPSLLMHAEEPEAIGKRPYEMDWAGRVEDHRQALVDFEELEGWRVEARNAEASFVRTREQQIFGSYVGKLTYRAAGPNPEIRILPPESKKIAEAFDAVTLWIYGNNWGYAPDPSTPPVSVSALFEDAAGQEFSVHLHHVDWMEWNQLHRRLAPDQIERVRNGGHIKGILITNGRNKDDRSLYFDSLVVFKEEFPPLEFRPRPERGIAMFSGQSHGTNTGPGKLPFPTRPETILPENLTKKFKTTVSQQDDAFVFSYQGDDGKLVYRLEPKTGTWSDLRARWFGRGREFQPCVGGGVYLDGPKGPAVPESAEHLGTRLAGDTVVSQWRLSCGTNTADVTYTYRLWNKSLVIDVAALGGMVAEVRYGHAVGLGNPRLVTNPFYPCDSGRPAVAVSGPPEKPLFLTGNTDCYLSNASTPWAANAIEDGRVTYNGGTRYLPKTDGKRNDCFERFFVTVSTRYEEMLPTIPNPTSPWNHVTGTRVWRAHGAGNRDYDARFWTECHRYGMTQVIVTDHETGWRDGGESFTFRTKPAPGKGGDQGQFDYVRLMQDKLGFVYGPYNNFTDFAPVNEFWSFDLVSRQPDSQLQHAWMRCYAPKPARSVEFCGRLAPQIQEKFKFSTAYCDVHTAVAPWHRVDYDARVPGAGTFAAVFYAFGEIMLLQKKAWNGPVYSEGNYHSFYSGLTDGNYGQDQSYRPAENPWLVDFDLRKIHDLCCNFGMGNPDMFYAGRAPEGRTREEKDAWLDRFLAATVAFGHPGFLTYEGGTANALRSYYMLQQLHSRYCLTSAAEIRYADGKGRLLETTAAVATGAHKRSQVVTRYSDGTVTAVNGCPKDRMIVEVYGRELDLPPNGYVGWTEDGRVEVLSSDPLGHRCDYAATPAYLYVDGRGRFMRFPLAAGNGIGVCRFLEDGKAEVILFGKSECGFAIRASIAIALDKERKELGPAQLRTARGFTYVATVEGAFSYVLSLETGRTALSKVSQTKSLVCLRSEVVPGEHVAIVGQQRHEFQVPADARPGERLWREFEGQWLDFTVIPLAIVKLAMQGHRLQLSLSSNLSRTEDFSIAAGGKSKRFRLKPGRQETVGLDLPPPQEASEDLFTVELRAESFSQNIEAGLRVVNEVASLAPFPEQWKAGICLRGGKEQPGFGQTGAQAHRQKVSSGDVTKDALFMHPPWVGGVGYTFVLFEPMTIPKSAGVAFRAKVGKGDGSFLGDGILYRVSVVDEQGKETLLAEQAVSKHEWLPMEADITAWAGRKVQFKLIADVGRADDPTGDWACWAETRIETLEPRFLYILDPNPEAYRHVPGPHPLSGLSVDALRRAKSGRLRYEGKGLSGSVAPYQTFAVLNGIELGLMQTAGGREAEGVFDPNPGIPLKPEAIRSLNRFNRLIVRNLNRDSFSIRRVWIELELEDGRQCASDISMATFTQPHDWAYAEGIGVPFDQPLSITIWFGL